MESIQALALLDDLSKLSGLPRRSLEARVIATVLRFNLVRVEIRELRPEVLAESDGVLVHYRGRTNGQRGLSTKTLA